MAYNRYLLSGSTNGKGIPIAATATAGTLIHTAVSGTSGYDEVYVWFSNITTAAVTLTIEWGGATDPGNHMVKALSIPPNSLPIPVITGQVMNNGLEIRAFCSSASALNAIGYINRIS